MSGEHVVRSDLAYETPLAELLRPVTSNASFFVRNHAVAVPSIDAARYALELTGTNGARTLALGDLRALPRVSEVATLACAGNARTAFVPVPGGIPWGFGAIATARWDGVRLRDLLALAGVAPDAAHVVFDAYDDAPDAEHPAYRRSLPLARAMCDGTIVADTMNGVPLPPEHGGPLRLVVAGWTANHSMKWLARIALATQADDGHWMTNHYRVPSASGTLEMLEACAPIAIVASPASGTICARDVLLQGVAYGEPAPRFVRVEAGVRHLGDAPVLYADGPYAWGRWSLAVRLEPGSCRIVVRPVDERGVAGPFEPSWNAKGYRYDGPHGIALDVA